MLRRFKWDDLLPLSIDDLTIDRDAHETSEVDEGHGYFNQVDTYGYMTRRRHHQLRKPYIPVDRLIDICNKRLQKAIDSGTFQTRDPGAARAGGRGKGARGQGGCGRRGPRTATLQAGARDAPAGEGDNSQT